MLGWNPNARIPFFASTSGPNTPRKIEVQVDVRLCIFFLPKRRMSFRRWLPKNVGACECMVIGLTFDIHFSETGINIRGEHMHFVALAS